MLHYWQSEWQCWPCVVVEGVYLVGILMITQMYDDVSAKRASCQDKRTGQADFAWYNCHYKEHNFWSILGKVEEQVDFRIPRPFGSQATQKIDLWFFRAYKEPNSRTNFLNLGRAMQSIAYGAVHGQEPQEADLERSPQQKAVILELLSLLVLENQSQISWWCTQLY